MHAQSCPNMIVIGRVIVYTQNQYLARAVEEIIEQEGPAHEVRTGVICMDGMHVKWVALPSPMVQGDTHYP